MHKDTIAAIATASGKGGIGIVRISGQKALAIAEKITDQKLKPRHAYYGSFNGQKGKLDQGIVIYFAAPHSFTGEDVVELQGHGSAIVLDLILSECVSYGARIAKPGEFSERAFLNNKIDLIQAEAIADIIESTSVNAAQSALRSLSGEFSNKINSLVQDVINLRIYIEAAIDFPEEEIDFVSNNHVLSSLNQLIKSLNDISQQAKTGVVIREGLSAIIIGEPNTGKSSLLNSLACDDLAIINQRAGTTRDMLKETLDLDGLTIRVIDTAGLRQSTDEIEQEGIRRVKAEIKKVDIILFMRDISSTSTDLLPNIKTIRSMLDLYQIELPAQALLIVINNKIDLRKIPTSIKSYENFTCVSLSAKQKAGLELLTQYLKNYYGLSNTSENTFVARRRHLDILEKSQQLIIAAKQQLLVEKAGELLAEDLRLIQQLLGQITGQFSSDDLLGEIFSSFCIGK